MMARPKSVLPAASVVVEGDAQRQLVCKVRAALKDAGITQAALARGLGISAKHMNWLMLGKTPLTLTWAEKIVAFCGREVVVDLPYVVVEFPELYGGGLS